MTPIKLAMVAGARPNFMKIAPLMRALEGDADFAVTLIHTGQHYDDNMSGQFFRDLGIPQPQFHLEVGSGSHAQQTAEIMKRIEPVLTEVLPAAIVVVGDVNSTAAAALVAKKLGIEVVHAEAGLRSFDRSMPEEINRIVTDSITDIFLVTEESGRANLLREGVAAQRIHLVGNLMIDSLRQNLERARESDIADRLGVRGKQYGVVTLHRPANVDEPEALGEILGALTVIAEKLPLLWPVHPRTRARLAHTSENRACVGHPALTPSLRLLEPLGYLDFLSLEAGSSLVLTDSGGIQEETTVLGVPCLTLRDNTERPVTIELGTNRLAGTKKNSILAAWREMQVSPRRAQVPPLWDGQAGVRSREVLREYYRGRATSMGKNQ
ncbi:MAG TPA: UDP-N-acetylglucosamine 2-epimerase (non-hydrolyzing) [Candidatus Bathyarchaeia archaeon]|nr:UDP-N-acetylglucosamine 2-epimerase (non-hydrolyzing) [Candidatus Bathyarchaeia archaeon]